MPAPKPLSMLTTVTLELQEVSIRVATRVMDQAIEEGSLFGGETWQAMAMFERYGNPTWFGLGDRDLATCLYRTERLRTGWPLSTITAELADSLGIDNRILPATDDAVRTTVQLADGSRISFQDYFVKRRHRDTVAALEYDGAAASRPAQNAGSLPAPYRSKELAPGPLFGISGLHSRLQTPASAGRCAQCFFKALGPAQSHA